MNTFSHSRGYGRRVLGASLMVLPVVLALTACRHEEDDIPGMQDAEPAESGTPANTIVTTKLLPHLEFLFDKLSVEKKDFTLDGTKAFNGGDEFLPGKIAIGFSYLLLRTPESDPKFADYLSHYREIADLTIDDTNKTWGIFYYVSALNKLKNAGLLERAVSAETLAKLRTKLDWRTFVNPVDYSLINLPTNYYGVAFSIARLRELLGWEDGTGRENLLAKMITHYETFSQYGFSDETDGQGRFDRYSVLLIGEICQRLIETGLEVSPQLKGWLRKSVDFILLRLNVSGNGFDYGRSLGPYADTAFLEVLSAAAHLDVLNAEEKAIAYAFATRTTAKFVEFWLDPQMKSVNLWEKGRRTDGYRGKHRILGENLSLAHQVIYTTNLWNLDGYEGKVPMETGDFVDYLKTLPRSTLTWFSRGDYDRAAVTYRDGLRIISLPLVNGGPTYHRLNPYFAVPYSYNMLSGAADSNYPHLQPKFTLAGGKQLIPASYIKGVTTEEHGNALTVRYQQTELDDVTSGTPAANASITAQTQYDFEPGKITRTATYAPSGGAVSLDKIAMEFGSFSDEATSSDGHLFTYAKGDVTEFEVQGLDTCTIKQVGTETPYQTPTGALRTSVVCESGAKPLDAPLTIRWVLKYKSPGVASFVPR